MRQGLLWVLGVWFCATGPLAARAVLPPPDPRLVAEWAVPRLDVPVPALFQTPSVGNPEDPFRFWARAELLLGRVKETPMPLPLLTTGSAKDAIPGAIGQPNTQVLQGNNGIGFKLFVGSTFALGGWIDADNILGVEGSGFVLEHRVNRVYTTSDNSGNPFMALPYFNVGPGTPGKTPW